MLTNQELTVVASAVAALTGHKDPALAAHAKALAAIVASGARARATVGAASASRRGTGQKGRPTVPYIVDFDPEWTMHVQGAKAAHALVAETLAEHTAGGRPPSLGSIQVSLSKTGHWMRLVETGNGTRALTVSRGKDQVPAEVADSDEEEK